MNMSIGRLYVIFTTWHMRLPYWFIAVTMIAFVVLLLVLLVIWNNERKYKRLYKEINRKLKESQEEVLIVASELRNKEAEYDALNKKMETTNRALKEKVNDITTLKRDILSLQNSIAEYENQYKIYEAEKKELLLDLQTRGNNIKNLNKTISSSRDRIQELKTENTILKKSLDDAQELLNRKNGLYETLEEDYNHMVGQNKTLEDSNVLLTNEIENLRKAIMDQASKHKFEAKSLSLKLERRDKKIETLNDSITKIKKDLQIVIEEKQLAESNLQEIQDKQRKKEQESNTNGSKNLIEKIAKW